MAFLELRDIEKHFKGTTALDGIRLDIEEGEFCVLLGPSGCGKSTLLNTIAGLVPQDRGSVVLNGRSMDGLTPRDRDVAMVFQNYALYPHMTVYKNLAFSLRLRKIPGSEINRRVRETAHLLGIENLLDRKPKALSGGQQQRVAMGRALVRRPALFLLDEPLSNLDARLRAKVRMELKGLHETVRGTFIYVTHDQVEAMTLGDKVVVMQEGRIHQVGTPDDIYMSPIDTFVARFVGSPEMNLLKGTLRWADGALFFEGPGFVMDLGRGDVGETPCEAFLGMRPEDVFINAAEDPGLDGRIERITDIGPELHVDVRLGEASIVVRAPKKVRIQPGAACRIQANTDRLHLFLDGGKRMRRVP